jgi:HAD superfamily hydrolase (TIGR01549 family)
MVQDSGQMIKAIFFDFYNTLVRFWPPLPQIQHAACQNLGIRVPAENLARGYAVADLYFNEENHRLPLGDRDAAGRDAFFARYEQIILQEAGVAVSLRMAKQIWDMAISVPKEFVEFEETRPVLSELKGRGYRLAVLTNLRRDMDELTQQLGIREYLEFCITGREAGEKPATAIFEAAIKRMNIRPDQAIHVGDQPRSDVEGARDAGLTPVLIDRGGFHADVTGCDHINSLEGLYPLLDRLASC